MAGSTESGITVFGRDGRVVQKLPSQVRFPGLAFSADGSLLASSGHELWSTADWTRRWQERPDPDDPMADPINRASAVAFSPDGRSLLLSTSVVDDKVSAETWKTFARLRDVATGRELRDFGTTLSRRPSFSPDGAWITAGPRVLHLPTGTTRILDPATRLSAFLPDGRIIGGVAESGVVTFYCP
jgi:WD40 repeat protein